MTSKNKELSKYEFEDLSKYEFEDLGDKPVSKEIPKKGPGVGFGDMAKLISKSTPSQEKEEIERKFVTELPAVGKEFLKRGSQIAPYAVPGIGGGSLLARSAGSGALNAIAELIPGLIDKEDPKDIAKKTGTAFGVGAGATAALSKAAPYIESGLSRIGSLLSSVPYKDYLKAVRREVSDQGDSIFKYGDEEKAKVFQKAGNSLNKAYDYLKKNISESKRAFNNAEKEKTESVASNMFKKYNEIEQGLGRKIGEVQRRIRKDTGNKVDTSEITKFIDDELDALTTADDLGTSMGISKKDLSSINEVKSLVNKGVSKEKQQYIEEMKNYGINPEQIDEFKSTFPSKGRLLDALSSIDRKVEYRGVNSPLPVSTVGEAVLKRIRSKISQYINSDELSRLNAPFIGLKSIVKHLGPNIKTQKGQAKLLSNYHAGKLSGEQETALERLNDVIGKNFIEKSVPSSVPQKLINREKALSELGRASKFSSAEKFAKGYEGLPEAQQRLIRVINKIQPKGKGFLDAVSDQISAEKFRKVFPGQGGGSGSGEGAANLIRTQLIGQLGDKILGASRAALTPVTSPYVHQGIVRSAPYIKKGIKRIGIPALSSYSVNKVSDDGSTDLEYLSLLRKERGL